MSTPSTHSQQPYAVYDDYVRSNYPEVLSPAAAALNIHWLQAALNPLQDSSLDGEFLDKPFGVSLLGITNGCLYLKWSTCFKEDGDGLSHWPRDPSTLPDIADTLGTEIDHLQGASENQIIILHSLPGGYRPATANSGSVSGSTVEEVIDAIGARLRLNPRLFIEHFTKQLNKVHDASTEALPSEQDYVQLEHPNGGYITATSASAGTRATSLAVVLDSSMLGSARSWFHPHHTRSSYMTTTYYGLSQRPVPQCNASCIYHLQPYTENIICTALATVKNSHSCVDMGCKGMPKTWQDLRSLTQLLHSDLTGLQRLLSIEAAKSPISDAEARLLRDLSLVTDSAISYERSIERQAQIQTSAMAVEEAEETYKQARSMEKLTAIAWIYIPLSFSATFFGMNVAQLNDSGPHIGYYFMLLAITLIISAATALLYTEWWTGKGLAWRERIQPGHTCRPRELSVAHLLWLTAR